MPRLRDLGLSTGVLPPGPLNALPRDRLLDRVRGQR